MAGIKDITTGDFDHALSDILDDMSGEEIMAVPGVYAVLAEELNNEILDYAMQKFHEEKNVG